MVCIPSGLPRLPARISSGVRRVAGDLHELDGVAIGIFEPVLPVIIKSESRFASDRQATLLQLLECGGHIVYKQAKMLIADRVRCLFAVGTWKEFDVLSSCHLEIDNPGRGRAF